MYKFLIQLLTAQPFSLISLLISMEVNSSIFKKAICNLTEKDIDDLLIHLPIKAYKIFSISKQLSQSKFLESLSRE